jgi:hypothetical protein
MKALMIRLRRLWRPDLAAFWMMLAFNGLSSVLATLAHGMEPSATLRPVLGLLALVNVAAGAFWMHRLWVQTDS